MYQMANVNLMPFVAAATTILTIFYGGVGCAAASIHSKIMPTTSSFSMALNDNNNYGLNTASSFYDNRWLPVEHQAQIQSQAQAQAQSHSHPIYRYGSNFGEEAGERRVHGQGESSGSAHEVLNGLTNLSGLGHITNGYGSVTPTHTEALALGSSKQEIPIYEEHNEDAAVAAVAASANDYGGGESNHHQQQQQQHPSFYNGFLPAYGGGAEQTYGHSWAPSEGTGSQHDEGVGSGLDQTGGIHPYAYDKISVGNFLPHYGQNAGYDEHQQQEQQQQQQQHSSYFSSHDSSGTSSGSGGSGDDYEEHPDAQDPGTNYLSESSSGHGHGGGGGGGGGGGHGHHSHHVDIINYVPVKHVKKQHVPVEKQVKIPISHAVIIPVRKPVPIHIPITKQVQVAVEKELKVPVERVIPVPVEKHIPIPVEKKVPYHVIKYVPIKVPKPFPVKVPVFKTVLHKVKSWW